MSILQKVKLSRMLRGMDEHDILTPGMVVELVRKDDPYVLAEFFFGRDAIPQYNLQNPKQLELIGRMLCQLPFYKYHQPINMVKHLKDNHLKLDDMNLSEEHHMYLLWMIGGDCT